MQQIGKLYTKVAGERNPTLAARSNFITRQFDRYEEYWQSDIERVIRNARMYWHVNFGQWPQFVVDKLRDEGRRPPTFPIIPDKIETLIGSFLANGFDMKYEPMDGKIDSLTLKLQDMYFSDKYNMDWDSSDIESLLDGFICVGYERMTVNNKVDDFGNLAFEVPNPRHLYLDPGWKTMYTRDLLNYMVYDIKTATQIIDTYPNSSQKLKDLAEREKLEGIDYGYNYGGAPRYRTVDEKWSSGHKVIEIHWVEKTDRWWEYDKKNRCFFPDTGFAPHSKEDRQAKIQYIQMMKIGPDDITKMKQEKRTKYIEAICPTIDNELFLTSGKDIIQTENCNLYCKGIRFKGQWQGIVDRLYDLQIGVNKGEMNIQDIQQRTAKGAFLLDRALAGGDPELEQQIEEAWNDPAARIWVDEGSTEQLAKGGIIPLPTATADASHFRQTERYYDLADRFSKVPAAQDARTEGSKESGKLYGMKYEAGLVGMKYLSKGYETNKRDKAEAYLLQAKITYAGVPRTFGKADTKDVFSINQPATNTLNGKKVTLDDISKMPRMKVVITPSRAGVNVRTENRRQYMEYAETLVDPADRLLRIIFTVSAAETGEFSDETKEEIRHAGELLKKEASLVTAGNIVEAQNRLTGAEMMAKEAQAQSGGAAPGPQQEAPPPQQMTEAEPTEEVMAEGTDMETQNLSQMQ